MEVKDPASVPGNGHVFRPMAGNPLAGRSAGPFVVRPAGPDDASGIASVQVESWKTTYRGMIPDAYLDSLTVDLKEPGWSRTLADPACPWKGFVAESGVAGVVGFAFGGPEREGKRPFSGELTAIYILDRFRGFGLGRRLVSSVAAYLSSTGHRNMMVWVLRTNPAVKFYEALGARPFAEKTVEIGSALLVETALGWEELPCLEGAS